MSENKGDILRALRESRNMSYREAAEVSGLSHSYIRYLETGKRPGSNKPITPTPETLKKLAEAYSVLPEELMMKFGLISSQMRFDFNNGGMRYATIDETKMEREHYKQINENKLVDLLFENDYINHNGRTLNNEDKYKILEFVSKMFNDQE